MFGISLIAIKLSKRDVMTEGLSKSLRCVLKQNPRLEVNKPFKNYQDTEAKLGYSLGDPIPEVQFENFCTREDSV